MSIKADPEQVVEALLSAGWQVVGQRAGLYKRLAVVEQDRQRLTLTVPLGQLCADYDDLMNAALGMLEQLFFDGEKARRVLARIAPEEFG